jgi:hypothetical protein
MLRPGTAVTGDAKVAYLAGLVELPEDLEHDLHIGVRVGSVHLGLNAPDVEVIGTEVTQAFFDIVELGLDVAVFIASRAQLRVIGADYHFLATAFQCDAIAETFLGSGDVEIIHSAIYGPGNNLGSVFGDIGGDLFLDEFSPPPTSASVSPGRPPVTAETDLGDYQVRLAQPTILHLRVVIEYLRCIERFGGLF